MSDKEETAQPGSVDEIVAQMDGKYKVAKPIANAITEGNYIAALHMIDSLPESQGNDALYLGVALGVAKELDHFDKPEHGQYTKLLNKVLDHCKGKAPKYNLD